MLDNLPDDLKAYLLDLQADPRWPRLMGYFGAPAIPVFRHKDAEHVESARAKWVYQSGRLAEHERFMVIFAAKE